MSNIEIYELATRELEKYGLEYVTVELGRSKRQAGFAQHKNGKPYRMRLSTEIARVRTKEETMNTIRHEIAHFLAGPGHGHDAHWRAIALSIGCDGKRCHDTKVEGDYVVYIEGTLELVQYKHRRPQNDMSTMYMKGRKRETLGKLSWTATHNYKKMLREKESENA
jgi:hypothetical protein